MSWTYLPGAVLRRLLERAEDRADVRLVEQRMRDDPGERTWVGLDEFFRGELGFTDAELADARDEEEGI